MIISFLNGFLRTFHCDIDNFSTWVCSSFPFLSLSMLLSYFHLVWLWFFWLLIIVNNISIFLVYCSCWRCHRMWITVFPSVRNPFIWFHKSDINKGRQKRRPKKKPEWGKRLTNEKYMKAMSHNNNIFFFLDDKKLWALLILPFHFAFICMLTILFGFVLLCQFFCPFPFISIV